MHSSTSNSDESVAAPRPTRTAGLALASIAVFVICCEAGARVGLRHLSKMESRIAADHDAVEAIRSASGQKPSILLLGNSLLLEGLKYPGIREDMADRARVVRFVMEQTTFWDWYYGIRRLLEDGARPDTIVLCMNPAQLIASDILGDYASFYLYRVQDIPAIRRVAHYDLNQESGLFFARFSQFYSGRNNLRNFALGRVDSAYTGWRHSLTMPTPPFPPAEEFERIVESRLRLLQADSLERGVRMVLLIPPGFMAGEDEVIEAGRRTNTDVLIPFRAGELPKRLYQEDIFHLNDEGAEIFTAAVEAEFRERLDSWLAGRGQVR
jgi:hypothetical protein